MTCKDPRIIPRLVALTAGGSLLLAIIALTALSPPALAATTALGSRVWTWWEDSPGHELDALTCVARGPDGRLYGAATYGFDYADGADIAIFRFNPDDDAVDHVVWKDTWNNPASGQADYPVAMTVDRDGNAIVAGQSETTFDGLDGAVVKWSDGGARLWAAPFASGFASDDRVTGVACDARGDIYLSGSTDNAPYGRDWLIVKYAADDGEILWRHAYSGPRDSTGDDSAEALVVGSNGEVFATGFSESLAGDRDLIVMRLSPDGSRRWIRRLDSTSQLDDAGRRIALRAGFLYVAGESQPASNDADVRVAKYTTTGIRRWVRAWRCEAGATHVVRDLSVDSHGSAVVAGWSTQGTPDPKAALVKWDTGGQRRWGRTFWNQDTGEPAYFTSLAADGDGRIWVAGAIADAASGRDALLVRYSGAGKLVWKTSFGGADMKDDRLLDVTLCGSDSVFAGGVLETLAGRDEALGVKVAR